MEQGAQGVGLLFRGVGFQFRMAGGGAGCAVGTCSACILLALLKHLVVAKYVVSTMTMKLKRYHPSPYETHLQKLDS